VASVPPHVSYKSDPSELHTATVRTERGPRPRGRGPRDRVCVHVVSVRGDVQTIYGFSLPHFLQLYYTVYSSATSTPHDRELADEGAVRHGFAAARSRFSAGAATPCGSRSV
jgi:hypothetical protein